MAEPKMKSSPFPIAKATEQSAAPRPLSPVRKLALPIGVAASLVLAGSAGAYAYASSAKTASPEGDGCPTRAHTGGDFFTRTAERLKDFLDPSPPPRMAGEMQAPTSVPVVPASGSASGTPPTPPPPPPNPNPPPLPGKIAPPHPHVTQPAAVPPMPDHPKLGGKPMPPSATRI